MTKGLGMRIWMQLISCSFFRQSVWRALPLTSTLPEKGFSPEELASHCGNIGENYPMPFPGERLLSFSRSVNVHFVNELSSWHSEDFLPSIHSDSIGSP